MTENTRSGVLVCGRTARTMHPAVKVLRCKPVLLKGFGPRTVYMLRDMLLQSANSPAN